MYKGKTILAIIPARGGSKEVPRKNIKYLGDKPLIAWSIEAAQKSKYVDRIIVSTEDKEIKNISIKYGAEIPFLRPHFLAEDDSSTAEAILYTVERLKNYENNVYDFILLLQPTSPLRNEKHIDEAIERLMSNQDKFDSLISVNELEHPVYWNRTIGDNYELNHFLKYDNTKLKRRQDFDKLYRLNGAIYLINTIIFINKRNFETDKTMAYLMDRKSSLDIDCLDDFELAEFYIKQQR